MVDIDKIKEVLSILDCDLNCNNCKNIKLCENEEDLSNYYKKWLSDYSTLVCGLRQFREEINSSGKQFVDVQLLNGVIDKYIGEVK